MFKCIYRTKNPKHIVWLLVYEFEYRFRGFFRLFFTVYHVTLLVWIPISSVFQMFLTVYHLKKSGIYSFMSLNTDFAGFSNFFYCLSSKHIWYIHSFVSLWVLTGYDANTFVFCFCISIIQIIIVYEFEYRFRGFFKTHMIYAIIVYFCNR